MGRTVNCLVSAYLDYRSCDSGDGFPSSEVPAVSPEADEEALGYPPGTVVDVELIDIFSQVFVYSLFYLPTY